MVCCGGIDRLLAVPCHTNDGMGWNEIIGIHNE